MAGSFFHALFGAFKYFNCRCVSECSFRSLMGFKEYLISAIKKQDDANEVQTEIFWLLLLYPKHQLEHWTVNSFVMSRVDKTSGYKRGFEFISRLFGWFTPRKHFCVRNYYFFVVLSKMKQLKNYFFYI